MISTGFAYGERSKIADAYAKMYAPKSLMNESCECGKKGCPECGGKDGDAKKTKTLGKLPVKHKVPAKTGSKLGVRKVLPFEKRDSKSSAKKFTPKVKKVSESTRYFCIADGDRVLCTNDIGESYFNKGGTCGDMRIYESKISAMKDISKVTARRKPNSKYKVRACECIGESVQFADSASGHPVNEGLWDMVSNVGSGITNVAKAGLNTVGGGLKAVGNLAQGNFKQAGEDALGGLSAAGTNLKDAGSNALNAGGNAISTVTDTASAVGGVTKAAGDALQGNFKQAGEELSGAGSDALGAVSDKAREADVGGMVSNAMDSTKKSASAIGNAAVQGGKALGNTIQAGNNVVGGGLKAAGNAMQGNFSQAGKDLKDGAMQGKQSLANAGANVVNAATNSNGQQQQGAPAGLEPKVNNGGATANTPPTQAQIDALNAGHSPVSQQTAEQIQQQNAAKNPVANNPAMQFMPDSMKNYMQTAPQNQKQQGEQQNKEQRRNALKLQIASLQKEYDSLA